MRKPGPKKYKELKEPEVDGLDGFPKESCCKLARGSDEGKTGNQSKAVRKLLTVLTISMIFMTVEFIGGALAHSLAIMTDAAHLLSDVTSFGVSALASHLALRQSSSCHSFGYHRAEVLGALLSVLIIWQVAGMLVYEAVQRVMNPKDVNGKLMFFIAVGGLGINLIMIFVLGHGHLHGDHGYEKCHASKEGSDEGQRTDIELQHVHGEKQTRHHHDHHGHGCDHQNMSVRAAAIHILGDLVQSIGVIIAGALIWWHEGDERWNIADPICTFIFAALVLGTTVPILRSIVDILMARVPRGFDHQSIAEDLSKLDGVKDLTDLHIWGLTPGIPLLSAHIHVRDEIVAHHVLNRATHYCRSIGIQHSTIQVTAVGAPIRMHARSDRMATVSIS